MHAEALKHLRKADPVMRRIIQEVGPCGLQVESVRSPFEALISAVAHQQLTGRVAEVILGRFHGLFAGKKFPSPTQVMDTPAETLRLVGFSKAKAIAIHDIARHAQSGVIPSRAKIQSLSDEEIIERLTQVRGVGRWTVEMLLIFTLGRQDVLPVDDFGVRKGFALATGLPELPKPKELREQGECWKPFRSIASWYLWRAADLYSSRSRVDTGGKDNAVTRAPAKSRK